MDDFLDLEKQEEKLKRLLENFSEKDKKLINEAFELAKEKHGDQKRDEGAPYVIHCIRVARSLMEECGIKTPEVICSTLLHDTIEDTDLKLKEVVLKFGDRVGEIVSALTREKGGETQKNKYQRKFQKFLKILKADKEIRTIKACDYLDNMRSWHYVPSGEKISRWFKEAETMYIPLAETVHPKIVSEMKKALAKAHSKWDKQLKNP